MGKRYSLPNRPVNILNVIIRSVQTLLRCSCCYCLCIAPRAQLLQKDAWLLHQISDKAPSAARDSSEGACSLKRRYPHMGNGEGSWCLISSPSFSVGFSIQDVAQYAPQRAHYHVDVMYLGFMVLRVRLAPTQFSTNIYHTQLDNTPLHSIPSV